MKFLGKKIKIGAFFGSSPHELSRFMRGIGDSTIEESAILIENYPFEPSGIYRSKRIAHSEIEEIHLDNFPPTLGINDELVFISAEKKEQLKAFAERNSIRIVKRNSNWDWITEPYLDTEFTQERKEATQKLLLENGIETGEIEKLRNEIGDQMYKYNFDTMLWEWGWLGLFDVLSAMSTKYDKSDFEEFYWRAMEIELSGKNASG